MAPPAFQLKARDAAFEFDLFLESTENEEWVFRRDQRVRRSFEDVSLLSASGIPILCPEIQLLYMAKSNEPKNELDFDNAHDRLGGQAAAWLRDALVLAHPGHRWLDRLATSRPQLG
jgi:hypothetical protein